MKAKLAAVLLAVLVLTGCGWEGTGVVVERTHKDSYRSMVLVGKVPIMRTVPEKWGYKVRDTTGKIHDVEVNYQYWSTHGVGTKFDNREKK